MMTFLGYFNYGAAILLILLGLYVMIVERNFIRKIIGMGILQTGVILFFISISVKRAAHIPIVPHVKDAVINPAQFANPLPHALMLTAIVVGVSTLGVALVLVVSIYRDIKFFLFINSKICEFKFSELII